MPPRPPVSRAFPHTAGQDYLEKARTILNFDYGSSKLVSVQALLLLAYREIGTGAMSASWMFSGMGESPFLYFSSQEIVLIYYLF